jgi:hypothetical protein
VAEFALFTAEFQRKPVTSMISRRAPGAATLAISSFGIHHARAAKVEEIRIDWATYNPVSLVC